MGSASTLCLGLGQVLTNNALSLFVGDEIDASMDEDVSITRAPCRKVMGVPGHRSQAGAIRGECSLVVLDTGHMLNDAFAVRCPCIDAEGEVSSRLHRHRSLFL
jgi:hypothetical protein